MEALYETVEADFTGGSPPASRRARPKGGLTRWTSWAAAIEETPTSQHGILSLQQIPPARFVCRPGWSPLVGDRDRTACRGQVPPRCRGGTRLDLKLPLTESLANLLMAALPKRS